LFSIPNPGLFDKHVPPPEFTKKILFSDAILWYTIFCRFIGTRYIPLEKGLLI